MTKPHRRERYAARSVAHVPQGQDLHRIEEYHRVPAQVGYAMAALLMAEGLVRLAP
jgi:hypothetical protein